MDETSTLYVSEQGAHVHRIGGRLLVRTSTGAVLEDIPLFRLDRVVLFGSVEVTTSALVHMHRAQIDLVYLTRHGHFRCRANPLRMQNAQLRLKQYELAHDTRRRLEIARNLVAAKVLNGRTLLRRRTGGGQDDPEAGRRSERLRRLAVEARECSSLESLRGIEGTAARLHFQGLRTQLLQDLGFERRVRRPPTDPVNALLSFGYTLLLGQVLSGIQAAGLDPYLGNLHETRTGRPALALDLMEEQRPLVDGIVLSVLNRMQLTALDFHKTPKDGIRMTEKGLQKFVAAYHKRMADTVHHKPSGRQVSYKELARTQASTYSLWLRGRSSYVPLSWR